MRKVSRKELRHNTEESLRNLLGRFEISNPSRKTERAVEKISKRFSNRLKQEIKKKLKENQKASKKARHHNGKAEFKSVA